MHYFNLAALVYNKHIMVYISMVQMAEWVATVPLMAVALGHVLRVRARTTMLAAAANATMLLLGVVAAPLVPNKIGTSVLLCLGLAIFLPFLWCVYNLTWVLTEFSGQKHNKKHIRVLGASVLCLWTLCPMVFFLALGRAIRPTGTRPSQKLQMFFQRGFFLWGCCYSTSKTRRPKVKHVWWTWQKLALLRRLSCASSSMRSACRSTRCCWGWST
ncbi:unnamed protein product [Heterosigma akashiwo]